MQRLQTNNLAKELAKRATRALNAIKATKMRANLHCITRQCARFDTARSLQRSRSLPAAAASRTTASRAFKQPTRETAKHIKSVVNATNMHVKTAHVHVKLDNI